MFQDPAHWKVYKNELKEDLDKLEGFLRLKVSFLNFRHLLLKITISVSNLVIFTDKA